MNCDEVRDRLGEYVAAALDADERAALERHVASCGACRSESDGFARLESVLRTLGPRRRRWNVWVAAVAAGLLVALLLSTLRPARLADGCVARGDVRVLTPRSVRLDAGEAFFDVRGPFTVVTPRGRVEVLGTSFFVRVEETMGKTIGAAAVVVTVAVVTGAVLFRHDGRETPVRAGEQLRVDTTAKITSQDELDRLQRELTDARARVAALEKENAQLKAPPKPVEPAKTAEDLAELLKTFDEYSEKALEMFGSKELRALIKRMKEAGPAAIEELSRRLLEGKTTGERFLAGLILEGIGDPAALPALSKALKSEGDEMVRRMASHASAIIGTKDALPALRDAMMNDRDLGVRVNSAYGAAKLGDEAAIKLLTTQYASADTPELYRAAVLQAMSDVAHPTYAPTFRQILATSKEMGMLLVSIGGLETIKDTSAIADLERIANGDYPATVREAAAKAARKIRE